MNRYQEGPWSEFEGRSASPTNRPDGPWSEFQNTGEGYWKSATFGGDVKPATLPQKLDYGARFALGKIGEGLESVNRMAGEPIRRSREALLGRRIPESPGGFVEEITSGIQGLTRIPTAMMQGQRPSDAIITAGEEVTRPKDTPMDRINQLAFSMAAPQVAGLPYTALGKTANLATKPARMFGKRALSWLGKVPQESISYRANHPEVARAKNLSDIAEDDVPRIADKITEKIKEYHNAASKVISKSRFLKPSPNSKDLGGAFTKDEVVGIFNRARRKLGGVYTPEEKTALNYLDDLKNTITKKSGETLTQKQIYGHIRRLDDRIPWKKIQRGEQLTPVEQARYDLRKGLDSMLKDKNPEYADIMRPMSEAIDTRGRFESDFGLERSRGGGYMATDRTTGKLARSGRDEKIGTSRTMDKARSITGDNLEQDVKAAQVRSDFGPDPKTPFNDFPLRETFGRPVTQMATDAYGMAKRGINKVAPYGQYIPAVNVIKGLGRKIDSAIAKQYMEKAGYDREKARQMAQEDGWDL